MASRDAFLSAVVKFLIERHPRELNAMCADLVKHLRDLPPKSPATLFRKRYGNLSELFAKEDFSGVLRLDGDVVHLEAPSLLRQSGKISADDLASCLHAHALKRQWLLQTLRNTQSNLCVRCDAIYSESAAHITACRLHKSAPTAGAGHGGNRLHFECCGDWLDPTLKRYRGCGGPARHVPAYDWLQPGRSVDDAEVEEQGCLLPYDLEELFVADI